MARRNLVDGGRVAEFRLPASVFSAYPANSRFLFVVAEKSTGETRERVPGGSSPQELSLDEILHEVAAEMDAKLEGLAQDQRIFGTYGPGPAREVLSKLLDGCGLERQQKIDQQRQKQDQQNNPQQ